MSLLNLKLYLKVRKNCNESAKNRQRLGDADVIKFNQCRYQFTKKKILIHADVNQSVLLY